MDGRSGLGARAAAPRWSPGLRGNSMRPRRPRLVRPTALLLADNPKRARVCVSEGLPFIPCMD